MFCDFQVGLDCHVVDQTRDEQVDVGGGELVRGEFLWKVTDCYYTRHADIEVAVAAFANEDVNYIRPLARSFDLTGA